MRRTILAVLFASMSCVVHAEAPAAPSLAEVETLITQTMKDWKVPGASVVILRGGEPVLVKGFGLRDVERKLPATSETLFRLASVSKSFTAAGVAALASQGKLDWNKPVAEYLPEFKLYTPALTAQVTAVDLLSHRTGLPRHDLSWYFNRDDKREEMIARLRYLEPNKPLREVFQYNNFMFLSAGYLTGRLLDTSWEDAMQRLLFKPLEMKSTTISLVAMEKNPDHAEPYQKDKQEVVQKVAHYTATNMAPAGMINSSAADMSRYLAMLMNGGQHRGKTVLAAADVQKMTTAQMVISGPPDPRYPELGALAYGLGLSVTSYRGQRLVQHGGAIDGFRANLAFLPEAGIGVVVLSNLGDVGFVSALSYDLFDRYLGLAPRDWSARYLGDEKKAKAAQDEAEGRGYSTQKPGTQPSHALGDYTGHYQHPGYGLVKIGQANGQLNLEYGYLKVPLTHYHYDVYEFIYDPVPKDKLSLRFETDDSGDIASLAIPLEPLGAPIVFKRVADPIMRTAGFLKPLAGSYELGAVVMDVVLREDGVLKLVQPNGSSLELEPDRGTTFRVKERAGSSLEFKRGTDGAVNEAVLHSPGSSSVLKRRR